MQVGPLLNEPRGAWRKPAVEDRSRCDHDLSLMLAMNRVEVRRRVVVVVHRDNDAVESRDPRHEPNVRRVYDSNAGGLTARYARDVGSAGMKRRGRRHLRKVEGDLGPDDTARLFQRFRWSPFTPAGRSSVPDSSRARPLATAPGSRGRGASVLCCASRRSSPASRSSSTSSPASSAEASRCSRQVKLSTNMRP